MLSRRRVLVTLGTAAGAGLAGCVGDLQAAVGDRPVAGGPCDGRDWTWPTAGGDAGRTGRADTAPPPADAEVVDLLAGVRVDGRQRLASSLPAVADATAFVPSGAGVVALDLDAPADGPVWTADLDDDVDAVPTVACGVLLVPGLNALSALDPATGERFWEAGRGGHHETTVAVADETVYLAGVNQVAVDLRSGEVEWSVRAGDTVAVDGGVYSTLNRNGTGGVFGHDRDGDERWHLSVGKIVGSATALDGTVWVADDVGTVYAIDAVTGATDWSVGLDGVAKVHVGLAARGDDVVVPAGVGERSYVLDAATGEPRWSADTGIVTGRPVVGEDWIALGRTNVGVTVYDRATGERRATWSREAHDLGTVDGLLPVEEGFVVRGGTTSGLSLIR